MARQYTGTNKITTAGTSVPAVSNLTNSGITYPVYSFADTDTLGDSNWTDDNNIFTNAFTGSGVGNNFRTGSSLEIDPGAVVAMNSLFLENGNGSPSGAAGAQLVLDASVLNTPIITAGSQNLAVVRDDSDFRNGQAKIILRNGATLIKGRNQGAGYRYFLGFQSTPSWHVTGKSTVVATSTADTDSTMSGNYGGTNSIMYMGMYSTFDDCFIKFPGKIEFQGNFDQFRNVSVEANDIGFGNTDGVFYLGAAQNQHVDLSGFAEIDFSAAALASRTSYTYLGISPDNTSITFQNGVPSDLRSYQLGFNTGGTAVTRGPGRAYYFQAPVTVNATRDTGGNALGAFRMLNADLEVTATERLIDGSLRNPQNYTWYTLSNESFSLARAGNGDKINPLGWPDARTQTGMRCFGIRNGRTESSSTYQGSNIYTAGADTEVTNTIGPFDSSAATTGATRRGWPFRAIIHDWGYQPYVSGSIGDTDVFNSGGTIGDLAAAEASADAVRSGLNLAPEMETDQVLTRFGPDGIIGGYNGQTITATHSTINVNDRMDFSGLYVATQRDIRNSFDGHLHNYSDVDSATFGNTNGQCNVGVVTGTNNDSSTKINFFHRGNGNILSTGQWRDVGCIDFGSAAAAGLNYVSRRRGVIFMRFDTNNWMLAEYDRSPDACPGVGNGALEILITRVIDSAGGFASAAVNYVAYANAPLVISNGFVTRNTDVVNYLLQDNVNMTPLRSTDANNVSLNSVTISPTGNGWIDSDAFITGLNMDSTSVFQLNNHSLFYSITGTGTVSGFPNNSVGTAIREGVTVGSGVNLTFERGNTYLISGDISNATLNATGASGDVILVQAVGGKLPTTPPANFRFDKYVNINFIRPSGSWDTDVLSTELITNMVAFAGTSQTDAASDSITYSTRTVDSDTLTYSFVVHPDDSVYFAFAARSAMGAAWYQPVVDNSGTATSMDIRLTEIIDTIVPTAFSLRGGATAHYNHVRDSDVIVARTSAVNDTDKMTITISDVAFTGTLQDGQFMTRLIQQKTNYLHNVALGYYPLNGFVIETERVRYSNIFVTWQKQTANDNIVAFQLQTLDENGVDGVNFTITTSNAQTYIQWSGPRNIGFLSPESLAQSGLATRADVYAANAAL